MEGWTIDINCDVGEGIGNEKSLMPLISSCNIACGGHAGDIKSMIKTVKLADSHNVKVGAHPSYPDKTNFGRKVMKISNSELKQSIIDQLAIFNEILQKEDVELHHIKAHGALYNQLAKDSVLAKLYLEAVSEHKNQVYLYVPFKSVIAEIAEENGFRVMYEAFGDRNYNDDLSLVSRKLKTALIQEPETVLEHILPIVKQKKVITLNGEEIKIKVDTICIHGDTPTALEILMYLSTELPSYKVQLQK
ncbi:5-oxoprolinase subunit PxpA [Flagellimonas sp. 389]|uniref:5-oxoprolinase subunit PxpA n=1 Tax=Flagellimonas sp. 389 TaxID=2835862 RepID=UPI001BD62B86|nr:5-oxoprolinase subunit PxpA [Flagellimonas sp. 389]MBS9464151.1 5-oxoprolinase subunit PxpA [Flagellimonas sp. 389]